MACRVKILVALAILTVPWMAQASRVLAVTTNEEMVTLSTDRNTPKLRLNDSICLFQNRREIACGLIGRITRREIIVQLQTRNYKVLVGQNVELRRDVRLPSSLESDATMHGVAEQRFDVGLGLAAGFNYFFPELDLGIALGRSWSLSITPLYMNIQQLNSTVQAYGGFAWLSYYYTHYAFRGVTFNAGAGFYNITVNGASSQSSATPFALAGTVGWRGKAHWALGMDIGVSAGLQYISTPAAGALPPNQFNGVLPLFQLTLGYSF